MAAMVSFLDPRGVPSTPVEPYTLTVDPTEAPVRLGLLANGFPDSVRFLEQMQAALADELPHASFELWDKRDPTTVVGEAMRDEIADRCDAVLAAYGH